MSNERGFSAGKSGTGAEPGAEAAGRSRKGTGLRFLLLLTAPAPGSAPAPDSWWKGASRMLARIESGRAVRSDLLNIRLSWTYADACREMIWLYLDQLGNYLFAGLDHVRASSVKATTLWWIDRRWHVTFKHDSLTRRFNLRIRNRDG